MRGKAATAERLQTLQIVSPSVNSIAASTPSKDVPDIKPSAHIGLPVETSIQRPFRYNPREP